jgi:hypothetical protein
LETHALDPRALPSLVVLRDWNYWLAVELIKEAQPEEARRLHAENLALFGRLARDRPQDPDLSLLAALCRLDQEPARPGAIRELSAAALRNLPDGVMLHQSLVPFLGDRIARDLFDSHVAGPAPRPDPGSAAAAVLDAFNAWSAGLPIDPELRFGIVHTLSELGAVLANQSRAADRPDDVRWAIDWLTALGRAILSQLPDDPGGHVVLSWASLQDFREASRLDLDHDTRRLHLLASLSEATTALSLKPADEWTRQRVAYLQEQYLALVAPGSPPP